jgi:hypothetical protein
MMPLPVRRKARNMEKVEILCRTATAQAILPTRPNTPDHACAIPPMPAAAEHRRQEPKPVLAKNKRFRCGIL